MVTIPLHKSIKPIYEAEYPCSSDSIHDSSDPYDALYLPFENDKLQESQLELETLMDTSVPPPVQQDEHPCPTSSWNHATYCNDPDF